MPAFRAARKNIHGEILPNMPYMHIVLLIPLRTLQLTGLCVMISVRHRGPRDAQITTVAITDLCERFPENQMKYYSKSHDSHAVNRTAMCHTAVCVPACLPTCAQRLQSECARRGSRMRGSGEGNRSSQNANGCDVSVYICSACVHKL